MEWKKREREKIGNKNLELKFFIFYELKMITIFVKKSHVVKNDVHRVMELIYIRAKKSQNPDFMIIKGPDFIIITRGHFMHLRGI